MPKYNIKALESKISGKVAIQLLDEPFTGVIISYGKVAFDEIREDVDNEVAVLKFEYALHDDGGLTFLDEDLESRLGEILIELLEEGVRDNSLIYTGGTDENRKLDIIESDSE
jgi:hypothetical protein